MKSNRLVAILMAIGMLDASCGAFAATETNTFKPGKIIHKATGISKKSSINGSNSVKNWNVTISPNETMASVAAHIDSLPAFEIGSFGEKLNGPTQTWNALKGDDMFRLDPTVPIAGSYDFQVFGTVADSIVGSYGGTIPAISAPVPEPGTYAMLIAGLGLMGAMARRRRR